jgi:hypothetical protein
MLVCAYGVLFPRSKVMGSVVLFQNCAMQGRVVMGNQREINVPTRHAHSRLCQQDTGKQERQ